MLSRLALRICVVEALKGHTHFGDNVLDSEITALDVAGDTELRTKQDQPFIAVYTDESIADRRGQNGQATDLDLMALHRAGITDLVIEIGLTAAMTEIDDQGQSTIVGIGFPATDANMEATLDMVAAQIMAVLTDPGNEWSELFRKFRSRLIGIARRRTSNAENTRIAAHQIVITLDLIADPVFGEPLSDTGTFAAFLKKLEEVNNPWLPAFKNMIGPAEEKKMTVLQRRYTGATLEESRAIADFPPPPSEATEPKFKDISGSV